MVVCEGFDCVWCCDDENWFVVDCCVVCYVCVVVCVLGWSDFEVVVGDCVVCGVDFDLGVF